MRAQAEIIEFLSRPSTYGDVGPVERIDTHISVIFLVGDRGYKLKRDLHFDYVDYGALERREHFCRVEASRNRRTAPSLYLGGVPVTCDADGGLALNGDGAPVEWLVAMRRFDQACLFDRLAVGGDLDDRIMRRLADRIYTFHQAAETTPGIDGSEAMRAVIEGNASELRAARSLNAQKVEALIAHSHKALRDMASLLDRRGASGAIRDCHGDLHLRNICLLDGEPTLFDGVEFNAEITSIDVLYDFAFLLMDLAHRGHIDLANVVFNRYLAMSGEAAYDGLAALGLFQSCRAAIRAHTTVAAAAAQPDASKTIALRAEAAAYLDLALQFLALDTPEMIAVGGLSGTGKSTVAAGLAPIRGNAPGAVILRSDVIRKRIYGAAPKDALPKEAYTRDATARVYERLAMIAATVLEQGQSVIVDAVYAVPAERDAIEAVARRVGAPFRGLWLSAPQSVLQARVAGRDGDASDADGEIVKQQLNYDLGPVRWSLVDASGAGDGWV